MTRPDARLLHQVIDTDQARAWLGALTADFFDRDARRSVLDVVRAGLPNLAPELDASGLDSLAEGLFQELCRQASRDATRPARERPPPLTGPNLEDRVRQRYPCPIAAAYHALTEQTNATAGFGCLLDTFEALIHYLAAVALSAYLRTDLVSADCNRFLVEMLLKGDWATGDLFALLREVLRLAGDCGGLLPYPLPAHLFTRHGKPTASHKELEAFVTLRNRKWGHRAGRDERSFAEILAPNRQRLEEELAGMPWLADWSLVRPVRIEDGRLYSADLLNGCLRRRARPLELALEPRDLAGNGGDLRADRDAMLLVAPEGGRYLPLFPLSLFQFRAGPGGQGAYFLQRLRWQEDQHPWRLARAIYVAYEGGCPEHEEGPREFVASSLERHADRLRGAVPKGLLPALPARRPSAGDPDHSLPAVRLEQESHLRGFVGRKDPLREVAGWIDDRAGGGYLLLLAPRGRANRP
jgi:hypothetical protein